MNTREKFSAGLLCLGLILSMLPLTSNLSFLVKPKNLLSQAIDNRTYFSVDQVAKFIVSEDSTIQVIDVRSPEEFRTMSIPGSINVPYHELLDNDPGANIDRKKTYCIFYSNGDFDSNFAFTIARGLNYQNTYVMRGGLNEWFSTIMNSSFTGDRISARENAVFETRTRARKMFTEINSLPDSLKMKFIRLKRSTAIKLDGGCE